VPRVSLPPPPWLTCSAVPQEPAAMTSSISPSHAPGGRLCVRGRRPGAHGRRRWDKLVPQVYNAYDHDDLRASCSTIDRSPDFPSEIIETKCFQARVGALEACLSTPAGREIQHRRLRREMRAVAKTCFRRRPASIVEAWTDRCKDDDACVCCFSYAESTSPWNN
jgi:hypothetical protein